MKKIRLIDESTAKNFVTACKDIRLIEEQVFLKNKKNCKEQIKPKEGSFPKLDRYSPLPDKQYFLLAYEQVGLGLALPRPVLYFCEDYKELKTFLTQHMGQTMGASIIRAQLISSTLKFDELVKIFDEVIDPPKGEAVLGKSRETLTAYLLNRMLSCLLNVDAGEIASSIAEQKENIRRKSLLDSSPVYGKQDVCSLFADRGQQAQPVNAKQPVRRATYGYGSCC